MHHMGDACVRAGVETCFAWDPFRAQARNARSPAGAAGLQRLRTKRPDVTPSLTISSK